MTPKSAVSLFVLLLGWSGLPTPLCALLPWSRSTDAVIVSATASDEYTQRKFGGAVPKPESYLFFQGKFYGGAFHDSNLEKAEFNDIVRTLGKDLVNQNYFPSRDPQDADLLIVVHWGTTEIYQTDFANNAGLPNDVEASAADNGLIVMEQEDQLISFMINAHLLGFRQELSKASPPLGADATVEEYKLFQSINQERYFVILMAYDYRNMRKGVRPTLLWSTRFSITGMGNNFTGSLPAMSLAAADHYGRSDGLKSVSIRRFPGGKVTLGPMEIRGVVTPETGPEQADKK